MGTNGTNGAPCTTAPYDGGVTVTCPGSAPVDVPNGTNGEPCTTTAIDGGVVVTCPGSSPVTVLNGNNGNPGQTGLGLSSGLKISITSVSNSAPIQVRFRVMDDRGNPVDLNGNYSINTPFVPRFSLAYIPSGNVPATDAGIVLAYKVYTQTGSATETTAGAIPPASVVLAPTAIAPTFPIPTGGVPATDAAMKGLLVENGTGFGDYTYTFPTGGNTQIANSSNKIVTSVTAPVTYDATKLGVTHTIWVQASRQTDILNPGTVQGFTAVDYEYNFVPNGAGTPTKREVVTTAACSKCHNGFKRDLNPNLTLATVNGFHGGGRVESPFCNTCHNPDRVTNPAANSAVFVHRLHGSSKLVANPDGGEPPDVFHSIQFGYPQDVRKCDTCHGGAKDGTQAFSNPTLEACGSCHDGVDFSAGSTLVQCTNPAKVDAAGRFIPCKHNQGSKTNAECAVCHTPATLTVNHVSVLPPAPDALQKGALADGGWGLPDQTAGNGNTNAAYIAAAGSVPVGAYVTTYDVKEVKVVAGKIQIVFKLKQALMGASGLGAAADVDFGTYNSSTKPELITGFVGGPSAYFAFSLPQDNLAAPADFNASASCYIKSAWAGQATTGASACTLSARDTATGYYTLEMTNVVVPASTTQLTGGIGYTYSIQTARPLTQLGLGSYPYNATTGLGGLLVPSDDVWKTATGYTARRPIVETARCNNCHAKLGVGPTFHAGQRNDGPTCSFCHNPNRTSSGWGANAKDFIHAIHGARIRTVPFKWHAISDEVNFSEVEFPSNINNCQACHAPGTNDFTLASTVNALPNMLMSTVATGIFNTDPVTNPTGWFAVAPPDYVTANTVDYGYGYSTSNVSATVPCSLNSVSTCVSYFGTQGVTTCSGATPCLCTGTAPCSLVVAGPVTVNNVPVNLSQKIGSTTTACTSGTPCTCTSDLPCTGTVATCTNAAPCNAQDSTLVKTPIAAACSACHDAKPTIAHMEAMGAAFYDPRNTAKGKYEQCLICHGPGTIAPITGMHKQ